MSRHTLEIMKTTIKDFFKLDRNFSSEEISVRESVREFVASELLPIVGDCFVRGEFPEHLVQPAARLGLLGAQLEGYECAGVSTKAYGLIMQELERGDSGFRSFASVQGALCMYPIHAFGTTQLKEKYLPPMARGELIGCFGLTEPDFGSNPAGMLASAIKKGDQYILNGTKMWITNGGIADLAIVWAKGEDGKVLGLVVDRTCPGFSVRSIDNKFSLRASITSELIFQDCVVPATHRLEVSGMKGPLSCLNQARFGISWGVIGAAEACFAEALEHSQTRIQFDRPIGQFQLVQAKLANMFNEINSAHLLAHEIARLKDAKLLEPQHISLAKMNNVSMALRTARTSRDILGASGVTYEYASGRHMANLESVNTYEGTEDIHRLIIGEWITGLSAFC